MLIEKCYLFLENKCLPKSVIFSETFMSLNSKSNLNLRIKMDVLQI